MKFDKHVSNMVKGIAIIFLLMRHLFTLDVIQYRGIDTYPFREDIFAEMCMMMNVCVRLFVFITAYGITINQNRMELVNAKELGKSSLKRYIKLIIGFWFVYTLSLLTVGFRGIGIQDVYGTGAKGIINGVTDALGIANVLGYPSLNITWWYMGIAILLIFVVPVIILVYKKIGVLTLVIAAHLNHVQSVNDYDIIMFLFCISLGIWCAEEKIFEKMYEKLILKNAIVNSVLKMLIYICVIMILFYIRHITKLLYWVEPIIAVMIGAFCMEMKDLLKGFSYILQLLGKYSMNIFLVHTLIYHYYFTEFVYSFRNWCVITLVLLVCSLAVSVLCEKSKSILGIHKLIRKSDTVIDNIFQ